MWSRERREAVTGREVLWNNLLSARGATADETDRSVATAEVGGEKVCEIKRGDWYGILVWRPGLMLELLEAAESSGDGATACLDVLALWLREPKPG